MTPYRKLDTAMLLARGSMPYMATSLLSLIPHEAPQLDPPTMAVTKDGILMWCPAYVEEHTVEWIAADLLHEVMHLLFGHHDRAKAMGVEVGTPEEVERNRVLANLANDACINANLRDAEKASRGALGKCFHVGEDAIFPETIKQAENLLEEERYRLLQEKGGGGEGGKQPRCGSCAGNPVEGEPQGEGRSDADIVRIRAQTAEAIQKYASTPSGRGSMPGGLLKWAGEITAPPKVDWRAQLARLVRYACTYRPGAVELTHTRPSRRQGGIGWGVGRPILSSYRMPVPNVAVVVDSSGSMGPEQLQAALVEVGGVLKALGAQVTIIACDAKVQGVKVVHTAPEAAAMLRGGGGTDMQPALLAVAELKPHVSVCVVCTDGEIPEVTMPPPCFRVIWTVVGGKTELPCSWGEKVFVDEVTP